MAARYTAEQIQQALEAGLISQEDADYLMQALEPGTNWGGIAGGVAGALGGAALGGMAGKKLADKFMPAAIDGAVSHPNMPKMVQDLMTNDNQIGRLATGDVIGGGLGAGLGVGPGAMAGNAVMPPSEGEGVAGSAAMMNTQEGSRAILDKDMALRMLVDPNTPPEVKQKILAALEAAGGSDQVPIFGQEADQMGIPQDQAGVPWGAILGTLAGGGAGAALGAKFGPKMAGMFNGSQVGSMADDFGNLMARNGDMMGGMAGGAVGAGLGGMAGSMMAPASASPYEDPYQ